MRCLVRDAGRAGALEAAGCEIAVGDVLEPGALLPALDGVRVAYYLIHSMGRSSSGDFAARDREGARNFAAAADAAGVGRIVFLGGLGTPTSKHLKSRHETAEVLAASGVPLTYLRAAAVLGGGSESFRTVLHLARRLPIMVTPSWTATRTQPIAIADVIEYLREAPELRSVAGREVEIGGPEVTTYGGMIDLAAEALGKRRPLKLPVPLLTPWLSSLWVGLVTPVDPGVARPLIEGLTSETVVNDPSGMECFEVEPTPVRVAMRAAVEEWRRS